jgi:pSer/pThr/pTyr-binding forkhead associated (FHA) protein
VIHDLKSTNGTFVNDRRVTRHPLVEGDVVRVGETIFLFRMDQA